MTALVVTIELIAALAIAVQAIARLNHMTPRTRMRFALVWIVLGGAASGIAAGVLSGRPASEGSIAVLLLAVAALVWLDRRKVR